MTRILVAGEINVDLILQNFNAFPELGKEVLVENCLLTLGSASLICAMGLAKLGDDVSFVGKAGCDTYGDFCVERMREAGIDVSRVIRSAELKTGITVSVSSPKDRAMVTYLGAITELRAEDLPDGVLACFNHLHVSSYYMQEKLRPGVRSVFARAHKLGLTTSLDPGYDPSEEWRPDIRETLEETDVFFPNEVEVRAIARRQDFAEALAVLANGRTLTVAKLGRAGAMALEDGKPVAVPIFPVQPVDTTGAGDSFNAGFLHAWLRRMPLTDALRWGTACGALSTRGLGGTGTQATAEEAEGLIRRAS
ncbi:MAG TPA: carbohydrate kinase family protein [Bryobacteraceae bacterium]|nr:carbohydrate kinase family protein [Bryobacteraceae bacterium]